MLGILPSISAILALQSAFLICPLVSGISLSASLIFCSKSDLSVFYLVFKTNFLTTFNYIAQFAYLLQLLN